MRSEGEYGVGAGHVPYVAQLKPGVLQILHEEGTTDPEKYFVAGGYALTHPDSTTVCSFTTESQNQHTANLLFKTKCELFSIVTSISHA